MKRFSSFLIFVLTILVFPKEVFSTLELYATFNNIGIIKYSYPSKSCFVQYCQSQNCYDGHELSEITSGKYVGSIFHLSQGIEYEVIVTCGLDISSAKIKTRSEPSFPTLENGMINETLYVSVDGTSNNCKSSADPCNINTLFSFKILPGTQVLFKNGIYNTGKFVISDNNGGTKENPIIFKPEEPFQSSNVIFDGSEVLSSWSSLGNGIYRHSFPCEDSYENLVMIRNFDGKQTRLLRYLVREDFENLSRISPVTKEGNLGYFLDSTSQNLDINIGSSNNINDFTIKRGKQGYFIQLQKNSDYFYFYDLTFQYFGDRTNRMAIYLRGSSYDWIKNCKFDHNFRGIALKFETESVLIEENEFFDSRYEFNWDGVKDDNGDKNMEGGGIQLYGNDPDIDGSLTGHGLVIRRNNFTGFFDAMNLSPYLPTNKDYYSMKTNEMDVHDNLIKYCRDDGIEFDRISSNIRVYNNRIEYTLVGISLAPNYPGPSFVFNNIVTNLIGWSSLKFQYGYEDPPSGIMFFYHNLVYCKLNGAGVSINKFPWKKQKYRNNIFFGITRAINIGEIDINTIDMDYDAVSKQGTTQYNSFSFGDQHFTSFDEFRKAISNQETHAIYYEELEVEETIGLIFTDEQEFRLNSSCLLKGNGEYIPGINYPNPDIGLIFKDDYQRNIKTTLRKDIISYVTLGVLTGLFLIIFLVIIFFIFILALIKVKK